MSLIQILIADDHDIVRKGLRALVESRQGWQVCAEVSNGREAVAKAKELMPHVVVLDLRMPELNGLEATRQIRQALPLTQVVILTADEAEEMAREVIKVGALGYVIKSDAVRDLVSAIESVIQQKPFFYPRRFPNGFGWVFGRKWCFAGS